MDRRAVATGTDAPSTSGVKPWAGPQTLTGLIESFRSRDAAPAIQSVVDGEIRQWSYADLHDDAARVAAGLQRRGFGPGDRVVLMASSRPEWIIVALGVVLAGAVLVPLDSQLRGDALAHVLADCDPVLVVTSATVEDALAGVAPRPVPAVLLDAPADAPDSWASLLSDDRARAVDIAPEQVAVLFYTSGTTGAPKGVPLTHGNLCYQIRTLLAAGLAAPGDRCLIALPLHHVYPFVVGMLTSFGTGMSVVLPGALQGPQILSAIQTCRATIILGVPRLYDVLLGAVKERVHGSGKMAAALFGLALGLSIFARRRLGLRLGRWLFRSVHRRLGPDIRLVVSGGAALDPQTAWTMAGLGWTVAAGYGLTETAPLISLVRPEDARFDSVGRPVAGTEIRIAPVDPSPGTGMGEVQVRGPGVFGGYHNLPDRNRRAFTDDGWFLTDDLGFLDAAGMLHVLGRASTLIVTAAGENIQPEDVEEAYERHGSIREAGVLQRDGGLAAIIVPASGGMDETALRAAVQQAAHDMPSYWRLTDVVFSRDTLARTRLGKIRRAELHQRYRDLTADTGISAGVLPREQMSDADKDLVEHPAAGAVWDWLASRYADRRLTLDSSPTLDLGIDSLDWMGVALEIRRLTRVEISEEATGRIATVRDLLIEVTRATAETDGVTAAALDDPATLLTARQRRWLVPLGPMGRVCARSVHALNRALARLLFRLEVHGWDNLPKAGNFIIAPNHTSVLDPFALAAALDYAVLRNTFWAAWTGMAFANPLFRVFSRLAQALPIEIDRAAYSSLAVGLTALGRGNNLIWFPEGGRSPDGTVQPFKLGTGMLLQNAGLPVVPVSIQGTFDAMPTGRPLPKLCRVRVTFGEAVTPGDLARSGMGGTPEERIADGLHDLIIEMAKQEAGAV